MSTETRRIPANPLAAGLAAGEATTDRIDWIKLSLVFLPLAAPISDAKVLTGRQKPLTEIAFLFAEIATREGHQGIGFSYSKRAGGRGQYAHAKEIAPELIGEDPNDIARLWDKLVWAGASVGRSGLATQACRWPSCSVRTATRCSATTLRAATCRCRSSRCSTTSRSRWKKASAASRSRSASPTP
jgi:hypothetical protein